jgi:hypothetical protein
MGDLSERDVEDILEGVQPAGRDDLAPVVELTTWMHASSEIEPAPAMRDHLFLQIEEGHETPLRSSRRSPAHLGRHQDARARRLVPTALRSSARPVVSAAAAAALLVGVIIAVRAGGPESQGPAVASQSGIGAPATGDTGVTTSTVPSTTTTAPGAEPAADPPPATVTTDTAPALSPPATAPVTPGPTAPPDATLVPNRSGRPAGSTTSTTVDEREAGDEDDDADESNEDSDDRRANGPDERESPEGAAPDGPPLSWWPSFDSSLWDAVEDTWAPSGESGDAESDANKDRQGDRKGDRDRGNGSDDAYEAG